MYSTKKVVVNFVFALNQKNITLKNWKFYKKVNHLICLNNNVLKICYLFLKNLFMDQIGVKMLSNVYR